jgi:hypothetical protein
LLKGSLFFCIMECQVKGKKIFWYINMCKIVICKTVIKVQTWYGNR